MQTQFSGLFPLIHKIRPGIIGAEGGFRSEKPYMPTWQKPVEGEETPKPQSDISFVGRFLNLLG